MATNNLPPLPFSARVQNKEEWDKIAPMLEAEGYVWWSSGQSPTKEEPMEYPEFVDCYEDKMIASEGIGQPEFEVVEILNPFHLTHPEDLTPSYQTSGSAGFDIMADEDIWIKSGKQEAVKTGLFIHNMPADQFLGIYSRSGLVLKHRVSVANAPGVVDCDFSNEILVILRNDGTDDFLVKRKDRIAQGIIHTIVRPSCIVVKDSQRIGGFGSTNEQTGPVVDGILPTNP